MLEFQKYINKEFIIVDPNITNKKNFFSQVSSFIAKKTNIKKSLLYKELTTREKLGSTAIGNGIAIPHCRIDLDTSIKILILISKKGIEFNSIDDKKVHIFFVIVSSPQNQVSYFRVLSHLAKTVEKNNIYDSLLKASSREEIYNILMSQNL